ncbi:MAG: S41 family peptidase [Burkholderiales bacterium]|nr:S41 family peptidase [Burkholderiales bacterium]
MQARIQKASLLLVGAGLGAVLTVGATALADKESLSPLPINELRTFTEVYARVKQDYVEPVDDKKLINEAINGMLTGLDPHSAYLDADAFKDLKVSTTGEFGGLGLEVNQEDGLVRVISPIDDTPAFRAGVKAGDYIMKIDDQPVRGITLTEAVSKMRGKPNTTVTLTILRKGEPKPLVLPMTRAIIKVVSVKSKLLEPGYGYLRLTQFQEHSTDEMAKAATALYKENKGNLRGLILDLRNDPGGVLNSAVGVSSLFLADGALVVYTDGRVPENKQRFTTDRSVATRYKDLPSELKSVPLVVLVNGGSASASEIVAGALQDQKRAVLVGTQTFGKGSVQTILPVSKDTAIKLTTARYFTPSGRSIQAKGVTPDIVAEETAVNGVNIDAFRIRESDLEHHLTNPQGGEDVKPGASGKTEQPEAKLDPALPKHDPKAGNKAPDGVEEEPLRPGEISVEKDYQLRQALNVLKVQQVVNRTASVTPDQVIR